MTARWRGLTAFTGTPETREVRWEIQYLADGPEDSQEWRCYQDVTRSGPSEIANRVMEGRTMFSQGTQFRLARITVETF